MSFKTRMWIGFAASIACVVITSLWGLIGLAASAAEPKWPGQDIATYGALTSILDVFSKIAGCVLILAVLIRAVSIHHAADSARKSWSLIGIAFTIASLLLPIIYLGVQKIYLPVEARHDLIEEARSMLAAPHPVAWILEQGLVVIGVAWVLFGAAFALSSLTIRLDQMRGIAWFSTVATGPIFILMGMLLSLGAWTCAAPLGIAVVITFVVSNVALSDMFLHMAK